MFNSASRIARSFSSSFSGLCDLRMVSSCSSTSLLTSRATLCFFGKVCDFGGGLRVWVSWWWCCGGRGCVVVKGMVSGVQASHPTINSTPNKIKKRAAGPDDTIRRRQDDDSRTRTHALEWVRALQLRQLLEARVVFRPRRAGCCTRGRGLGRRGGGEGRGGSGSGGGAGFVVVGVH